MAIVNRTLDASQQQSEYVATYPLTATGVTLQLAAIPYPSTLKNVVVSAIGLSGAPTFDLRVQRFIVGTGVTSIAGGATTLTATAWGTSGVQSMVLAASGSSLLSLQAKDVLAVAVGGSNTAAANIALGVVIQATQDILSWF